MYQNSPTGRRTQSAPALQTLPVPLSPSQREACDNLKKASRSEVNAAGQTADYSSLERRIFGQ